MPSVIKTSIALLLLLPSLAFAQLAPFQEGTHYQVINPAVKTQDASKIEVTELFWYGCIHCFKFESLLQPWKKTLPADVAFVPSPAMWNKRMSLHAQAFYTAVALDVLDKVHGPLFNALNVERKKLADESEIKDLFVAQGVDGNQFSKAFNSFGVNSLVSQADARARSYKITGTPELVVNGKYRISSTMAGSQEKMLEVANYLINLERLAK